MVIYINNSLETFTKNSEENISYKSVRLNFNLNMIFIETCIYVYF